MKIKQILALTFLVSAGSIYSMSESPQEKLFRGVKENNIKLIQEALKEGANINSKNKEDITPLYMAAAFDHIDAVKVLLESNADINLRSGEKDNTPLMIASALNKENVVNLLLEKKAEVDLRNNECATALMYAAVLGFNNIVKKLLDAGAKTNIIDNFGFNAMFLALYMNHNSTATLIKNYKVDKLIEAIKNNDETLVIKLINLGTNVNSIGSDKGTPLYQAIVEDKPNMVNILLKSGAQVDLGAPEFNMTPLMKASAYQQEEIVDILLNANANVNLQNNLGFTALMFATISGNINIIKQLLKAGADISLKNSNNKNALDLAIKNYRKIVEILKDWEKNIQEQITHYLIPPLSKIVSDYIT